MPGVEAAMASAMASSRSRRLPGALRPGVVAAALALAASAPIAASPQARADRFGVYHWGADFSAWPGSPDRLNWGADQVAALGSRTIRVFLGAGNVYGVDPELEPGDADSLRRVAEGPAYAALFADPRFRTYLLTVYPPGAYRGWQDGYDPAEAALEREQVARMGERLLADPAHAGKTFIVLNWEGDHATSSLGAGDPGWEDFAAWIAARADGVRDARARVPGSRARLLSGLEFNFVERLVEEPGGGRRWVPCGEGEARCVIDTVAPRVAVDVYSYSAWQSVNVKLADARADLALRLREDLSFALAAVRAERPRVRMADFILGEIGFARSLFGECAAARHLREALAAADSLGVAHAIVWQALDNRWRVEDGAARNLTRCGSPEWFLYGLFRGLDGGLTLLGATFRAWLAGEEAAPAPARCPAIRPGGVRDPGARGRGHLAPGGRVAVAGADFSPAGNRLRVLQAHAVGDEAPDPPNEHLTLPASHPWRESPQRIEAALPAGALHDGCALVYVTDAAGIDSNAALVRVRTPRSPRAPGRR
jgi:hypothetical protein